LSASVAASVVLLACCSSNGGSSSSKASVSTAGRVAGGTVSFAQGPQSAPNYIFPLVPPQFFSVANVTQFQALMYRPLYWFGNGNKPAINDDYSIGEPPTFSADGMTVTIKVKPWKWSDGETLSSRNVLFFLNLLKEEKTNSGAYVPGLFPDNVTSYSAPDDRTVVIQFDKRYNPDWLLYNELSQITPLPWHGTRPRMTHRRRPRIPAAFRIRRRRELRLSIPTSTTLPRTKQRMRRTRCGPSSTARGGCRSSPRPDRPRSYPT